ncbi:MAG TPA: PQQ-binding-like beta-propeller repeat protein, partial [Gemmatimonadaceae bacterium]|nr:PQQ-binding-like beta-propeller repeat protein [Gemmatimonadaceae bacterium]
CSSVESGMTIAHTDEPTAQKPLRLWPGVAAVVLGWLAMLLVPAVAPAAAMYGILGGLVSGLAVLVWWLFFSRAPWSERLGAIVLMVAATFVTSRIVHESLAGAGMGILVYIYAVPVLTLALVAGVVASRRRPRASRRASIVAAIVLACAVAASLRIDGMSSRGTLDVEWRWTPTVEERLLAEAGDEPAALSAVSAGARARAEWPGFRGPHRNGIVRGVRIETDWTQSPPVELWRRPVGPGWSSFAVDGDRVYTQEQLGEDELVSCYDLDTGEPVWRHRDATRFWEANAGAGPRATPTLHDGRVYSFGATGILNALDARDGSVVWSRNAATDTGRNVPYWGFAASPVVIGDLVIAAAAGTLAAYDIATGDLRWVGPEGKCCYSSPHPVTIDGVAQILLLDGAGVTSVAPEDGTLLWRHEWPGDGIVQPALTEDGDVLIGTGSGMGGETGIRRVAVARSPEEWTPERGSGGWTVEERWTSAGLKPYFNDFVVHQGHAYGFDGGILACVDLEDGERKWKGGRYGDGQLVLLADQDLLLVLSEKGELALVGATPDQFTERARFPAIESKTWNHPVLAGDVLLVRNSEEMAAFRLALAGR